MECNTLNSIRTVYSPYSWALYSLATLATPYVIRRGWFTRRFLIYLCNALQQARCGDFVAFVFHGALNIAHESWIQTIPNEEVKNTGGLSRVQQVTDVCSRRWTKMQLSFNWSTSNSLCPCNFWVNVQHCTVSLIFIINNFSFPSMAPSFRALGLWNKNLSRW